jgi:excinuclease ABC subunit C
VPEIGKYKKLIDLANKNAKLYLEIKIKEVPTLKEMKELLNLKKIPHRIEAIDISHIKGEQTVGSLIVFENALPLKREYRKYRIKTVEGIDDFACLYEVVKRRYTRILEENKPLPDLILIDGGKGQLSTARRALKELGLNKIPTVSIAKREELMYIPEKKEPIVLMRDSSVLKLIQQIRDEAHRFALSFHRRLRAKTTFQSILDEIPGIGEKKKKKILFKYKSVEDLKNAPQEELVKLIGEKTAKELLKRLYK